MYKALRSLTFSCVHLNVYARFPVFELVLFAICPFSFVHARIRGLQNYNAFLYLSLPDARIVHLSCFWNECIFYFRCNKLHANRRRFAIRRTKCAEMQMRLWAKSALTRTAYDLASLYDISNLNFE